MSILHSCVFSALSFSIAYLGAALLLVLAVITKILSTYFAHIVYADPLIVANGIEIDVLNENIKECMKNDK